jgi:lia operon protein LiaF
MNLHLFNKMLFGFALIGAGVLFLLDEAGLIQFSIGALFSTFWPVFIIYAGLSGFLYQSKYRRWPGALIWNVIVIAVGAVFLLNNLEITDISFKDVFQYLLPLMLIAFGIGMLVKPSYDCRRYDRKEWKQRYKEEKRKWKEAYKDSYKQAYTEMSKDGNKEGYWQEAEYIHTEWKPNTSNRSSFIGDVHLGQDYWELTPMNISHFIGDTVIDLTKASIPTGETRLNVSAFIGDVKLFVPNDFDVEVRVQASSFMGEMNVLDRRESGMMRSISTQSPHYMDAGKKIHLVVSMFIGDIVVKRVG